MSIMCFILIRGQRLNVRKLHHILNRGRNKSGEVDRKCCWWKEALCIWASGVCWDQTEERV